MRRYIEVNVRKALAFWGEGFKQAITYFWDGLLALIPDSFWSWIEYNLLERIK